MTEFVGGAVAMGFVVACLFFLRAWRQTRQTLFLLFAVAFLIQGVGRTALAMAGNPSEQRPIFFLPRLIAYLLIVGGLASKNLPTKRSR